MSQQVSGGEFAPTEPPAAAGEAEALLGPAAEPQDAPEDGGIQSRIGWSLAALGVLTIALSIEGNDAFRPPVRSGASLAALLALVAIALPWILNGRAARVQQHLLLALWAIVSLLGVDAALHRMSGVTDELAIDQRAAELIMKGVDPYAHALFGTSSAIPVASGFQTSLIGGGVVSHLSYPSLAAIADIPALLLGFGLLSGSVTDIVGVIVTVVVLYLLMPVRYRWSAVLIGTLPAVTSLATGGSTDFVYIPFLIVAAWRWDRFADPQVRGVERWIGPVALGIAMAIKQTPWLVIPFILIGLVAEARERGLANQYQLALRYLAISVGVFAVLNLPFLVWGPSVYLQGVFQPFSPNIYPEGFGLVALDTLGANGGVYGYLSYASLAALLACVALAVARYPALKRGMLFLIPVSLFLATRSLAGYMFFLLPGALVAAVTVRPARAAFRPDVAKIAAVVCGVAAAGLVIFAFLAAVVPPPLQLSIRGVSKSENLHAIYQIEVAVTNTTDEALTPSYATFNHEQFPISEQWRVYGSATIPAHAQRTITLSAPSLPAMPRSGTDWRLAAFTRPPAAISYSPVTRSTRLEMTMSPSLVRRAIKPGEVIGITVQLRGIYALAEEKAWRRIRMTAHELATGAPAQQVRIDGGEPGHASARWTNSHGSATFNVQAEGGGLVVLHASLGERRRTVPAAHRCWCASSRPRPELRAVVRGSTPRRSALSLGCGREHVHSTAQDPPV